MVVVVVVGLERGEKRRAGLVAVDEGRFGEWGEVSGTDSLNFWRVFLLSPRGSFVIVIF